MIDSHINKEITMVYEFAMSFLTSKIAILLLLTLLCPFSDSFALQSESAPVHAEEVPPTNVPPITTPSPSSSVPQQPQSTPVGEQPPMTTPAISTPAKPDDSPAKEDSLVQVVRQPAPVQIISEAALDFGFIRARRGDSGWVVVDPGGGFTASPNVSFSRKILPAPGLVRIKAPPESVLLLNLELAGDSENDVYKTSNGLILRSIFVGRGIQPLPRNGAFWELQMPRGETDLVEVQLSLGGELQFTKLETGCTLATKLRFECVSTEMSLPVPATSSDKSFTNIPQ